MSQLMESTHHAGHSDAANVAKAVSETANSTSVSSGEDDNSSTGGSCGGGGGGQYQLQDSEMDHIGEKQSNLSRSITDFSFCTYLSDLAVDKKYQSQGIGKTLIKKTWEAAPLAKLILLAAPAATSYYPKIGMDKHPFCFSKE